MYPSVKLCNYTRSVLSHSLDLFSGVFLTIQVFVLMKQQIFSLGLLCHREYILAWRAGEWHALEAKQKRPRPPVLLMDPVVSS